MQIVLGLIFLAAFVTWILIDRHFFIKRISKEYSDLLDDTFNKYKTAFDEVSERASKLDESKWDVMLVNACGEDQENLRSKFPAGWSTATLNSELELAAKEYADAFKSQAPLKEKVARIVNLLYLFILSRTEGDAAKIAHLKKLKLKDLN